MAQPVSAAFELARKAEEPPTKELLFLSRNFSLVNTYGSIATASAQKSDYEAPYSNDGNLTHLDKWWETIGLLQYASIVAFWQFEEASGTIYDQTANDNDGTYNGALYQQAGKITYGLGFDGTNDIVEVNKTALKNLTGSFSVSAWIKCADKNDYRGIFTNFIDSGTKGFSLFVHITTGKLVLMIDDNGYAEVQGTTDIGDNAWHFVVGTFDGTTAKIYVDGTSEGSETRDYLPGNVDFYIGRVYADVDSSYFKGIIDESIVWNICLTPAEVTTLWASGAPTRALYTYSPTNTGWLLHTFADTFKIGCTHIIGHPTAGIPSEFKLQYWDGADYQDIIPTKCWGMNKNNSPIPIIFQMDSSITQGESFVSPTTPTYSLFRSSATYTELKQGFSSEEFTRITKIELKLAKVGTPVGNIWVEIWDGDGIYPENQLAVGSNMDVSTVQDIVSGADWFDLTISYDIMKNKKYHIVLCGDFAISGSNYVSWSSDFDNNYTKGEIAKYDGTSWSLYTGHEDGLFQVWGYGEDDTDETIISNASESYILFTPISTTRIKLVINNTISADAIRICEMECYFTADLSNYLYQTYNCNRQMDSAWQRFMGGQFTLELLNEDRRFSPEYSPTPLEIAEEYFNPHIKPGCQLIAYAGFDDENVVMFHGFIDDISGDSASRTIAFSGRDKFKFFTGKEITVNQSDVTTKSIENCLEYVLNKCNIPSSQMYLATSYITIDYLMFTGDPVSKINNLVQAMGNALWIINEGGQFQTKFLTNNRQWIQGSYEDFSKGSNSQTNYSDVPGSILLDIEGGDINDGGFETFTGYWTGEGTKPFEKSSGNPHSGTYCALSVSGSNFSNQADVQLYFYVKDANTDEILSTSNLDMTSAYVQQTISLSAYRNRYIYILFETRKSDGNLPSPNYGKLKSAPFYCSGTSTFTFWAQAPYGVGDAHYLIDDCAGGKRTYYSSGIYTSQKSPLMTDFNAWGLLDAIISIEGTETIVFETQSSSDGGTSWYGQGGINTWDALINIVSASNRIYGTINSPTSPNGSTATNVRWRATLTTPSPYETTPKIMEVAVNWTVGGGSALPTTASFIFVNEGNPDYPDEGLLKSFGTLLSDQQGGDTAIYNVVRIKSKPLFASAAATTVWNNSSITLEAGTYIFWADLDEISRVKTSAENFTAGELDTDSFGAGADPGDDYMDITLTGGGNTIQFFGNDTKTGTMPANISKVYLRWSNTKVMIKIVATGAVTLTTFQIAAKTYTNYTGEVNYEAQSNNYASSIELYGQRILPIDNDFIQTISTARTTAISMVNRFSDLKSKITNCSVCFSPPIQLYDLVLIVDYASGINSTYYAIGIAQNLTAFPSGTLLQLTKI